MKPVFSTTDRNELSAHAAELLATAPEIDDIDIRRIVLRIGRGINSNSKVALWVVDASLLAALKVPTYKLRCKCERLEKKVERFHRVGFNPLLIVSIISLVVQIVRLWKEWFRKTRDGKAS